MPITHLTSTAVFQSSTGNRTVTPNASTATGDLMVLPVGFQDSAATTITTPTGFMAQKSAVTTGTLKSSLFSRVRQSGDTTWTYAPNQSVETSHLVLSIVGGNAASLLVGADGTRAASGAAFVTTAPSITTTVAGARVFIIATERTTANETVDATVNNGFTKILHAFQNGTSAESIFIAYKDMPTAGAVGATSVTFQNTHASNGYAVLISVDPASTSQDIAGTVAVVSTVTAAVTSRQAITGTVAGVTATTGAVTVTRSISGMVAASSTVSAALTSRQSIAGTVSAVSGASGAVTSTQGIAATVQAVSSVEASLTVTRAPLDIAGTVEVHSATIGTLTFAFTITATVVVQSSITADFTVGVAGPSIPIPDTRTLTGTWSATLAEITTIRTLTSTAVSHTLEDK